VSDLSTTSLALLGLLAIQSWSAYELKEFMTTSALRTVWPRAASSIYREPKVLVSRGLATVTRERHLGPERSVYSITPKGRAALRSWLATPAVSRRIEDEGLVHVLFADHGTKAQLLDQIGAMRATAQRALVTSGAEQIARAGVRFPERTHISALVMRYALEQLAALLRWCDWATAEVSGWPDDLQLDPDRQAELARVYDPDWIRGFLANTPQLGRSRHTAGQPDPSPTPR
jgi:DNA-binding PadR family transcriptional regulator